MRAEGPTVQTDVVRSTWDSSALLGAGALGLIGLGLAGGAYARTSRKN